MPQKTETAAPVFAISFFRHLIVPHSSQHISPYS